ncbi:MAG TPA: UbiA family prenyltransferase [Pseudonocardiaceae bacterium]|nr:UbiA family prenyltransferase [Pseudonocardiaceae bacterium]
MVAHVETWRPYTACYVGLVGLAGAAIAVPAADPVRLFAAWGVPTLGWLGGLYGGDYFDRELDAKAKPHRPIPSGRMRAGTALGMLIGCTTAGGALGLLVNWRTALLVLAALVTGIAYSAIFKARGVTGNVVRGLITVCAFLFGTMCVLDWPPPGLLLLAAVFLFHDTGSNLVGALRDMDGDRDGGYDTLPVRRGTDYSVRVVTACFALSYACAIGGAVLAGRSFGIVSVTGVVIAAVLCGRSVALLGERPLTRLIALHAHEVLVLERVLLAGALLCLGIGWIGVPITVAALVAAGVSQRAMRRRHELGQQPSTVDSATVLDYVRSRLAELDTPGHSFAGLANWHRVIEIRLREPDLVVSLVTGDGKVREPGADDAPDLPKIVISTTGAVFADIFLHGTSNPRRAYLARTLSVESSARDMMQLNQLFNAFRAGSPGSWTVGRTRVEPVAVGELPERVVISDTTLRDGEQMPGVAFSPNVKVDLARRLAGLGVPLIEVGFPAVSADERTAIRTIVEADLDAAIQVIARPVESDVRAAIDCGAQSVAVFIGTSPGHLERKLRLDVDEALRRVDRAVRLVKQAGRQAVFAAEDATRTDPAVLCRFYAAAADAGADALGLADTAGVANPWSLRQLVAAVGEQCPLPLAMHCHNDLGLATANSIAGLLGGASGVQCSVLGIGERAGNAPLEQVVLSLETSHGYSTGLDLRQLEPLAAHVAGLVGTSLPPFMPVVGDHAFVHESGLHVDGITRDPSTYEPYSPDLVGRQRRIVLGKHSGRSAVLEVAEQHGVALSGEQADRVLEQLKTEGFDNLDMATVISQYVGKKAST